MGCEGARMALRKIFLKGVAGCATRLVAGLSVIGKQKNVLQEI